MSGPITHIVALEVVDVLVDPLAEPGQRLRGLEIGSTEERRPGTDFLSPLGEPFPGIEKRN